MEVNATWLEMSEITRQVVEGLRTGNQVTVLCLIQDQTLDLEVEVYSALNDEEQSKFNQTANEYENGWMHAFNLGGEHRFPVLPL